MEHTHLESLIENCRETYREKTCGVERIEQKLIETRIAKKYDKTIPLLLLLLGAWEKREKP